uniref:Uncharacterized protein n=1 Tax=Anguilla anguilla TaxID=7936 RepID=A0A0E9QN85_ANGAN
MLFPNKSMPAHNHIHIMLRFTALCYMKHRLMLTGLIKISRLSVHLCHTGRHITDRHQPNMYAVLYISQGH